MSHQHRPTPGGLRNGAHPRLQERHSQSQARAPSFVSAAYFTIRCGSPCYHATPSSTPLRLHRTIPTADSSLNRRMSHPTLPLLRGTQPGLLDPSQSSRLLVDPQASLHFATFDGSIANGDPRNSESPPNERRRIVIETFHGRSDPCRWRFVPPALMSPGLQSEGTWPRVISICKDVYRSS